MNRKWLAGVILGLAAAATVGVLAQTSTGIAGSGVAGGGGGSPAGSTFATQYRAGTSTFGGTGPGSAGNVLTSNGAGAAPTFQPAAGGGVTQTTGTGNLSYVNACTTTPTQGFAYVKTGMEVTLTFTSQFSCTSDSTAMVSDALPAAIWPARTQVFAAQAQNTGSVVQACFQLDTSGILTWFQISGGQCANSGAWTASGIKGPLTLIGTSPFIASSSAYTYTLN